MYISAFPHRDELFEITNRWLSNKLESEDSLRITKIITYDSFAAWEVLLRYIDDLLKQLVSGPIKREAISSKKDLKDSLCNSKHQESERIKPLVSEYMDLPEFYYVGSPITGYLYRGSLSQIAAMCRYKRVKRIAEKASRYASMLILDRVQATAKEMLEHDSQGTSGMTQIPPDITIEAEKKVMSDIKKEGIKLPVQSMTIKDVLGLKIIDHGLGEEKLESVITKPMGAKIIEKERHSGNYNATHYVVEIKIDPNYIENRFKDNDKSTRYIERGLPRDKLNEDFAGFMATGADTVQIDLIVTSFEELIESEIGRSMHETRIFEQRQQREFYGNIPINIEYIIEYLMAVGLSPTIHLDEIPIRIWGRYLPDTLSHRIRKLYSMPEYSLIGT